MSDEIPVRQLRGRVRALRGRRVIGWVTVKGEVDPVTVDILIDQRKVASGVANLARPDVQSRGFHPTGECGFDIAIPEDVALADGQMLECVVENAEGTWSRNPAWIRTGQDGELTIEPVPIADREMRVDEAGEVPEVVPVFGILPPRPRWRIVLDVMHALVLREVRNRYGAFRFGYFWAVAQPVIFIATLQFIRFGIRGRGGFEMYGVNGFYFFQLGVIPWFMFAHGYHQAMGAMRGSRQMYSYRQIQPIDVILMRCMIEFVLLITTFMSFVLIFEWLGWKVQYTNPLAFVAVLVILFVMTVSMGVIADVLITRNEDMRRVFSLFDRPLFFLSGVFFTLSAMPDTIQKYLLWNPLMHAMELGRASMLEHYPTPCSWGYLCTSAAVMLMLALGLYRQNVHRVMS